MGGKSARQGAHGVCGLTRPGDRGSGGDPRWGPASAGPCALEAEFVGPSGSDDASSLCVHRPLRPDHLTVAVLGADFVPGLREVDTAGQLASVSTLLSTDHLDQLAAV